MPQPLMPPPMISRSWMSGMGGGPVARDHYARLDTRFLSR
jgi:hypothetical protein